MGLVGWRWKLWQQQQFIDFGGGWSKKKRTPHFLSFEVLLSLASREEEPSQERISSGSHLHLCAFGLATVRT
jgi:hypothetical protein